SRTDGGTVFLSNNANSFTGGISISDGAFRGATLFNSGVNSAFGRGTSITLGQGSNTVGRLEYTGVSTSTNRIIISRNDNNTQTAGAPSGRGIIDVTTAGETLTLTGGIRTSNSTVANIGQITLSGVGNGEVQGQIGGTEANAASVVSMRELKDGAGTWTLSAANTYTRDTVVLNGVLNIRHGSALGTVLSNEAVPSAANAGTTVNSGATLQIQNDISVGDELLTLSGNGFTGQTGALVNVSGTNNYAGTITLAANATIASDSGRLNLTSATALNGSAASRTLTLAGAGEGSISAGLGANISTLTKNGTGAWTLAGTSAHTGANTINAGTLNVTGTFTGNGTTTVNATGTLNLTGSLTGTGLTTVNNNGTLAGTGTLAGALTVANGGILSAGDAGVAGSTGTLTVGGLLVLNSTSILRFDLGTSSDLVVANGGLTLDGVLSIGKGPGLTTATYKLFDYTGTLTDNGVTVPAMVGYDAVLSVDTANTDVNLLVTALAGQYWDGGDTAADGSVDGGSGVWTNAGSNWTSADGSTNTSWADAPVKVAFFEGATGGIVTVQDAVTVTGLQFGKDYTLAAGGGSIQTTTTATEMRVISGVTATVEAPVKGTGGINKTGEGTLVFTAAPGGNTYSGPTLITAGTLKIGTTNPLPTTTALTIGAGVTTVGVLTDVGTLDLTEASQTVASLTIASNSTANNIVTIGSGQTLSVTGTGGFKVGIANTEKAQNRVVFTGAGSLVVDNTAANFESGLQGSLVLLPGGTGAFDNSANTNTSFTDLSALGSFTANVNEVRVGHGVVNTSTLTLSNTSNTITANTVNISNTASYNAGSGTSSMILGAGTNIISTNTLNIGLAKGNGTVKFASQTAGSAGTVVIGGKTTALVDITVASSANVNTGATPGGTLDLRGHVATVTADDLFIGRRSSPGAGGTNGNVYFDAGTFTANKVEIGTMSGDAAGNAQGQLTVAGGTFTVNIGGSFKLGTHSNTTTGGTATGTLTISGGTFITNADILEGGGTNSTTANTVTTINLSGGTLDMTGKNIGSATNTINNVNLTAGVLKDVGEINGGAAISKTGAGTLVIQGDSGYTGATTVSAGTLLASNDPHGAGSATGTNNVSVAGTSTLGGNGRIAGNVTLASGTTLVPGGNATSIAGNVSGVSTDTGTLRIVGDLSVAANATLAFNLKTAGSHGLNATFDPVTNLLTSVSGTSTDGGNDRLIVGGAFGLDAASNITVTLGSGVTLGYQDTFDLLDWSGVDIPLGYYDNGDGLRTGGTADNALWNLDLPDITAFNSQWIWDVSQFGSTGVIAIVPEPSRAVLILVGMAGLMLRRRRKA
ncbi:MAG: autotransporter-associated beta strand repeat-containing protein, partial [Prosthecobacter sp.]